MTDVAQVKITLELSYYEARMVRAGLYQKRKRFERQSKQPFTPAPGSIDANVEGIKITTAVIDRIDAALDKAIQERKT